MMRLRARTRLLLAFTDVIMLQIQNYPKIVIAVFIERPTPFLKEMMEKIFRQNYPKRQISLFIRNAVSVMTWSEWDSFAYDGNYLQGFPLSRYRTIKKSWIT